MFQLNTSRWLYIVLLLVFVAVNGSEWIVERVQLLEINQNYLNNTSLNLVSYSRRKRVINFYTDILETFDNNVTVSNEYEEFMNNEYRPVFVGLRFKLCDFLEAPYVMIKQKFGIQCPLLPNKYSLYNLTVRWDLIPNFFPFKQGRVISTYLFTETKEVVAVAAFYTRVL